MKKYTIILMVILSGMVNHLFAYPISPMPLRKLVMESQYIIVGFVTETFSKETDDMKNDSKEDDKPASLESIKYTYTFGPRVAKIAVKENLQGKIGKDTIEISFNPNMICPTPDRYYDSTFVISFINKDENGDFYTNALSYGAKTLKKEEIEIYKARIFEMQQILQIKDSVKQFYQTVEWLVKCAENEPTSWEGSFELNPESNFMSYYSEGKKDNYKRVLSNEQKLRLKKSILNLPGLPDFGILDIVYQGNEIEIDAFLLKKLKSLKEDHNWKAGDFIDRLKHKSNSQQMKNVLKDFEKLRFEYNKDKEIKVVISKFIKLVE